MTGRRIRPVDVERSGDGLRWVFVVEDPARPDVRVVVRTTLDLRRVVDVQTDLGPAGDHPGWPDEGAAQHAITAQLDWLRVLTQLHAATGAEVVRR